MKPGVLKPFLFRLHWVEAIFSGCSPTLGLSICFGCGVQTPQLGPVVRGSWRTRGTQKIWVNPDSQNRNQWENLNTACVRTFSQCLEMDWLLFSVCILSCVFWMLSRLCSLRDLSSWEETHGDYLDLINLKRLTEHYTINLKMTLI